MKDKKVLAKFIGIVLASAAVGAVVGFGTSYMRQDIYSSAVKVAEWFYGNIFAIGIVIFAAMVVAMLCFLSKGKRMMKACVGDENEASKKADRALSIALGAANVTNIVMFVLMGINLASIPANMEGRVLDLVGYVIFFLAAIFFCIFMEAHIVNLLKKMNPHMRGNALDTKFQKEWFESMDEAEKFATFEAAYRAFTRLQKTFPIALGIVMLITFFFGGGPLAIFVVGVLWAIQSITYIAATMRAKHKGKSSTKNK